MKRGSFSVLLVDDDSIYQFTAKKTIEATGLASNIWVCSNGEEAIRLLKKNKDNGEMPDVIFLDVNMPVMNGWEFLDQYHTLSKENDMINIPVFIVSSSVDEADIVQSKNYTEVLDFITKPVLKEKFQEILTTLS
jgi:CheY-like chemotaxis protein